MFAKKENGVQHQFDLIIGQHSRIEGNIQSEGSVRVDGTLTGSIICAGDVLIGNTATITGPIEADSVEISGAVEGNVTARGAFRIYETGVLFGDINVASFAIDTGGVFEGMCHINITGIKSPSNRQHHHQNTGDLPFHVMRENHSEPTDLDGANPDTDQAEISGELVTDTQQANSHQDRYQGKHNHKNLKSIK